MTAATYFLFQQDGLTSSRIARKWAGQPRSNLLEYRSEKYIYTARIQLLR